MYMYLLKYESVLVSLQMVNIASKTRPYTNYWNHTLGQLSSVRLGWQSVRKKKAIKSPSNASHCIKRAVRIQRTDSCVHFQSLTTAIHRSSSTRSGANREKGQNEIEGTDRNEIGGWRKGEVDKKQWGQKRDAHSRAELKISPRGGRWHWLLVLPLSVLGTGCICPYQ